MLRLCVITVISLGLGGAVLPSGPLAAHAFAQLTRHPAKITLFALDSGLFTVAGRYVWVLNCEIADVVAPRALVIESRDTRYHADLDVGRAQRVGRALVVTRDQAPRIEPGVPVEVIGTVYTLAGARVQPSWPAELTPQLVSDYRDQPIVIAETIQTPGGVPLYGTPRP